MGPAYHNGVPLVGVPENPIDLSPSVGPWYWVIQDYSRGVIQSLIGRLFGAVSWFLSKQPYILALDTANMHIHMYYVFISICIQCNIFKYNNRNIILMDFSSLLIYINQTSTT